MPSFDLLFFLLPTQRPRGQSGNGRGGRGRRRSYGRPKPEPSAKQKQFLRQIAEDWNLDAKTIGHICEDLVGKPVRDCDRNDLSRLIDALLEEAA